MSLSALLLDARQLHCLQETDLRKITLSVQPSENPLSEIFLHPLCFSRHVKFDRRIIQVGHILFPENPKLKKPLEKLSQYIFIINIKSQIPFQTVSATALGPAQVMHMPFPGRSETRLSPSLP